MYVTATPAGIKEGLYDLEALASYLVYRLNVLNPLSRRPFPHPEHFLTRSQLADPAYLSLIAPAKEPVVDSYQFLELLAKRLGMVQRGGVYDLHRAADWFIRWWREKGGLLAAAHTPVNTGNSGDLAGHRRGWGFDLEWAVDGVDAARYDASVVQRKMEECIDVFEAEVQEEDAEGGALSVTQERKAVREELKAKRLARMKARAPIGKRN